MDTTDPVWPRVLSTVEIWECCILRSCRIFHINSSRAFEGLGLRDWGFGLKGVQIRVQDSCQDFRFRYWRLQGAAYRINQSKWLRALD